MDPVWKTNKHEKDWSFREQQKMKINTSVGFLDFFTFIWLKLRVYYI